MPKPAPAASRMADLLDRLGRYIRGQEHSAGLNPAQWEALRYLGRANRYSRNPTALTEFLGSTKGTVSQTVIALEAKGLVTRKAAPADRRQIRLELTEAGRLQLTQDPLLELAAAASLLDGATQARTADALTDLLVQLQRRHDRKSFGVCRDCRFLLRNDAAGVRGGPHRCGLTREPLSERDTEDICAEQEPAAA